MLLSFRVVPDLTISNPERAPTKFLAGFAGFDRCRCICSTLRITNAADLSSGVFAILISVTQKKIRN